MRRLALTLALVSLSLQPAFADILYDRSGSTLKGLVVEEHHDRVVISTEGGEQTVLRSQIEEIFYSEPERNYLYLGNQALEEEDFEGARGFFEKALQINPDLSEASDALKRMKDLQAKRGAGAQGPSDPQAALQKQWGMALVEGKEWPAVGGVQPGSLADRAGLADGDELVASWSSSLGFLPAEQVAGELTGPPGSRIKLTFQRQIRLPSSDGWDGAWPGMRLSMERLGLTFMGPEGGKPASTPAGLKPGDRIVSINGTSTRYTPLGKARQGIEDFRKKGVVLGIHRDVFVTRS